MSAGIAGIQHHAQLMLWKEAGASCVLGKHPPTELQLQLLLLGSALQMSARETAEDCLVGREHALSRTQNLLDLVGKRSFSGWPGLSFLWASLAPVYLFSDEPFTSNLNGLLILLPRHYTLPSADQELIPV